MRKYMCSVIIILDVSLPWLFALTLIKTTIVPVVKNKSGNLSDSNNNRPIAIATITSKLFESVVLLKCSDYLTTCDNQFWV